MTPKKPAEPKDEQTRGVLDDAASLDTTGIGIIGGTAQVSVVLPTGDDDDLVDDGVVDGEVVDLVIDEPVLVQDLPDADAVPAAPEPIGESIVIELPAEVEPPAKAEPAVEATPVAEAEPVVEEEPVAEEESVVEAESVVEDGAVVDAEPVAEPVAVEDAVQPEPEPDSEPVVAVEVEEPEAAAEPEPASEPVDVVAAEAAAAAAFIARAKADIEAKAQALSVSSVPAPKTAGRVASQKEAPVSEKPKTVVPQPARARAEVTLAAKRLDDLGDASRESADLLTADRLLDPSQVTKPEPEGAWSHFLYTVSGRRLNIGDGKRARDRKALSARIAAPLPGGARFVPVLSRKGGVGKTTITALLGMALADAREDRVIAVDANPDRGTLADRVVRPHHSKSVRDLVRIHDEVKGYHDISAIVARDATRLDVLASDSDPRVAEAFSDSDYRDVADVAAHYYSLVLTDTGTGIVHSVMSATLDLADQLVIVSGLSVDEARLASETLTWLETNGYADQARDAIVVLNQSTPGTPLVRLNELEAHFGTRAKKVVRVPYDAQIAGGGTIVFANLQPETRIAARELAALLVEGLRAKAA
ncbi:MAG: MinD/ParA family protein [Microbacterium sp.]|nr:MinD/ParA family protein [Microbacterium sp.]